MRRVRLMYMEQGAVRTPVMDEVLLALFFPDEYLRWRGFAARPSMADLRLVDGIYGGYTCRRIEAGSPRKP